MTRRARVWPGRPYPLGATFDGRGVNFALHFTAWRVKSVSGYLGDPQFRAYLWLCVVLVVVVDEVVEPDGCVVDVDDPDAALSRWEVA